MLTYWRIFPYLVALLETAAALAFIVRGDVRMSLLWSGYAVAAWALAGIR